MIYPKGLITAILLALSVTSACQASESQLAIEQLTQNISQTKAPLEKSKLYTYRARQYARTGEWQKTIEDYNQALNLNHQGWIHLERSRFLMNLKKYDMALEDAMATKEETPPLSYEADKIIQLAQKALKKQYDLENPPTIILDEVVDPYRRTRFDVMRERGIYARKGLRLQQVKQTGVAKKTTKKTSSSSVSKPKRG